MLSAHTWPAPSGAPALHPFSGKSAASVFVITKATGRVPVFVTFTVTGGLALPTVPSPKFTLFFETEIPTVPPFPASAALCGLPAALSITLSAAVSGPAAIGMKSTDSVQLAPAVCFGDGNAQAFAPRATYPKLVEFEPAIAKLEMSSSAVPAFVNNRFCVALVTPPCCDPRPTDAGPIVNTGVPPDTISLRGRRDSSGRGSAQRRRVQ